MSVKVTIAALYRLAKAFIVPELGESIGDLLSWPDLLQVIKRHLGILARTTGIEQDCCRESKQGDQAERFKHVVPAPENVKSDAADQRQD